MIKRSSLSPAFKRLLNERQTELGLSNQDLLTAINRNQGYHLSLSQLLCWKNLRTLPSLEHAIVVAHVLKFSLDSLIER